jgi:hypothetical protein
MRNHNRTEKATEKKGPTFGTKAPLVRDVAAVALVLPRVPAVALVLPPSSSSVIATLKPL